jgi:hypothetical protein
MLILNKCGLQNHIGFSGYITERAGVYLSDLFASTEKLKEINSYDKSIIEKVALIETMKKNILFMLCLMPLLVNKN